MTLSDTIARMREADAEIRDVSKTYDGEAISTINALVERLEVAREALAYYGNDKHWLRGGNIFLPNYSMYQSSGGSGFVAQKALLATDLTKGEL